MRAFWVALGLAVSLLGGVASAQGVVQQGGPIVPFHVPAWGANGTIMDGGTNTAPAISTLAMFNGSQCPLSISSQTGPGVSVTPYTQFSVCQTLSTTTLTFLGLNGAATPDVVFDIGGVDYPFPGPGSGDVVGPGSSTVGDITCFNNSGGTIIKDCGGGPPGGFSNAVPGIPFSFGTNDFGLDSSSLAINWAATSVTGSEALQVNCANQTWIAGTSGQVTSCARIYTTTPAGRQPFTWGLTVVNNDNSTLSDNNQPTSIYSLMYKNSTGIGISLLGDLEDTVLANPVITSVTEELDLRAFGSDSHHFRVGTDMQLLNSDPSVTCATGCSISGTTLTASIANLTGTLKIGDCVYGVGITPSALCITTGADPTWTLGGSASISGEALTFQTPAEVYYGYRTNVGGNATNDNGFMCQGPGVTGTCFNSAAGNVTINDLMAAGQAICFDAGCGQEIYEGSGTVYIQSSGGTIYAFPTTGEFTTPGLDVSTQYANFAFDANGTYPNAGNQASQAWNFTGSLAESDFFNDYTTGLPTKSFCWYQLTGASAATQEGCLASTGLNVVGGYSIAGNLTGSKPAPAVITTHWYQPPGTGNVAGAAMTASTIYFAPFYVERPIQPVGLATRITTAAAAGNVQLALYAGNATTGRPTGAALCSTTSLSTTSATTVSLGSLTCNSSNPLVPGVVYWMAANADNSTVALTNAGGNIMANLFGSATLGNLSPASGATGPYGVSTPQTFNTWPTVTSNTFTEVTTAIPPLVFLQSQ